MTSEMVELGISLKFGEMIQNKAEELACKEQTL